MSHAPTEVLDTARWAEAAGWHGVWYADHYMPNTGSEAFEPGDTHECWAMLPAIAAVTERVRIGSLVSPTSVHHPAVLANRAATIDHISNGRMVLGIGAGWQINEHRAYGIELEPPKQRVDRFDEAIQIIRSLLDTDRTTFDGSVYSIIDAPSDPAPIQSPLPILVGTGSPRMLRITARHADEWNTWGGPDMAGGAREKFDAACESVDRDPASMWTSVQALVMLSDDVAAVEGALASPFGARMIAGSAAQLIDQMGRYAELGFDEFIVPDFNLGKTPEARRDSLERIHEQIVSQIA
jgi:alkanesulfonate monooxygenase SsuD/methylene tetrahydromethanopterin reductase-like flavin-dependent oxidoreductase (luciferase family)